MINKYLLLIILLFLIYFITIKSEDSENYKEYENFNIDDKELSEKCQNNQKIEQIEKNKNNYYLERDAIMLNDPLRNIFDVNNCGNELKITDENKILTIDNIEYKVKWISQVKLISDNLEDIVSKQNIKNKSNLNQNNIIDYLNTILLNDKNSSISNKIEFINKDTNSKENYFHKNNVSADIYSMKLLNKFKNCDYGQNQTYWSSINNLYENLEKPNLMIGVNNFYFFNQEIKVVKLFKKSDLSDIGVNYLIKKILETSTSDIFDNRIKMKDGSIINKLLDINDILEINNVKVQKLTVFTKEIQGDRVKIDRGILSYPLDSPTTYPIKWVESSNIFPDQSDLTPEEENLHYKLAKNKYRILLLITKEQNEWQFYNPELTNFDYIILSDDANMNQILNDKHYFRNIDSRIELNSNVKINHVNIESNFVVLNNNIIFNNILNNYKNLPLYPDLFKKRKYIEPKSIPAKNEYSLINEINEKGDEAVLFQIENKITSEFEIDRSVNYLNPDSELGIYIVRDINKYLEKMNTNSKIYMNKPILIKLSKFQDYNSDLHMKQNNLIDVIVNKKNINDIISYPIGTEIKTNYVICFYSITYNNFGQESIKNYLSDEISITLGKNENKIVDENNYINKLTKINLNDFDKIDNIKNLYLGNDVIFLTTKKENNDILNLEIMSIGNNNNGQLNTNNIFNQLQLSEFYLPIIYDKMDTNIDISKYFINLQVFNDHNDKSFMYETINKSNIQSINNIKFYWNSYNNDLIKFDLRNINKYNDIYPHTWLFFENISTIFNNSDLLFKYSIVEINKDTKKFRLINQSEVINSITPKIKYNNYKKNDKSLLNIDKLNFYLIDKNDNKKQLIFGNKTTLKINDIIEIKTLNETFRFNNITDGWIQNKRKILYEDKDKLTDINFNNNSTFVIYDKKLWGVGNNSVGQLGLDKVCSNNKINYKNIIQLLPNNILVDKIYCGDNHSFIKINDPNNDSNFKVSGYNKNGQLGLGHKLDVCGFTDLNISDIIDVKLSNEYSTIRLNNNKIYSCGKNKNDLFGYTSNEDDNDILTFRNMPIGYNRFYRRGYLKYFGFEKYLLKHKFRYMLFFNEKININIINQKIVIFENYFKDSTNESILLNGFIITNNFFVVDSNKLKSISYNELSNIIRNKSYNDKIGRVLSSSDIDLLNLKDKNISDKELIEFTIINRSDTTKNKKIYLFNYETRNNIEEYIYIKLYFGDHVGGLNKIPKVYINDSLGNTSKKIKKLQNFILLIQLTLGILIIKILLLMVIFGLLNLFLMIILYLILKT